MCKKKTDKKQTDIQGRKSVTKRQDANSLLTPEAKKGNFLARIGLTSEPANNNQKWPN